MTGSSVPVAPDHAATVREAQKARLYAALKHEKSCSCGECSGGLNTVDDVFVALDEAQARVRLYVSEVEIVVARAEAAEAERDRLAAAVKDAREALDMARLHKIGESLMSDPSQVLPQIDKARDALVEGQT